MQISLFQTEDLQGLPTNSDGARLREAMPREHKYQESKKETTRLQRQWKSGAESRTEEDEMRKMKKDELENQAPQTVVLVSCVSKKKDLACAAQDLYCSDWFKKARIFAETNGDRWLILSALHGVLEPASIIEPYNHTLSGQRRQERQSWATRAAKSLRNSIPPQSKIIILAGEVYREFLISEISDRFEIEIPLLGLGIGQQLQALNQLNQEK